MKRLAPASWTIFACLAFMALGFGERPNIVLIMADDLGYGDLGCYGSRLNDTPHIDGLAASGLRFTDFHSAGPMCTPTRVATLTGLYQQRFGAKFDAAISGVRDHDSGLPLDAVTIAEVLKETGYATGCFGKWHLGYTPSFFPTKQGFEEFVGLGSGDGDFFNHVDRSGKEDWWRNETKAPEEGYTTDLLTRHSVDFIKRHSEQPFFLYVPHLAIHFPWQGPNDPPHRVKGVDYADDKWGVIPNRANVSGHVKAMIESLDRSVGTILSALEVHGLRENTLVIFTSDNGGYIRYAGGFENISSNGPLRGQKSDVYEGGHRVPAIVSWPEKIDPGVTDELGHSTDWFSSFLALAGISNNEFRSDGVDLAPLFFHEENLPERNLYWRIREDYAVRSGPWKLTFERGRLELFNLDQDIGERSDLAELMPERVELMKAIWRQWNSEVDQSAEAYQ